MQNLGPIVREALTIDMVVDITTIGRKTGQPRRFRFIFYDRSYFNFI